MSSVRPSPKGDESEEIVRIPSTSTFQTSPSSSSRDLGRPGDESEDEEEDKMDHTGSHFVMLERNKFRKVWTGIVTVLLMYIGTWFLFQLTFIDLHKPEPMQVADFLGMDPQAWQVWSLFVDGLFWFDSFIYFFFSYNDDKGREVDCWPQIARRYACGSFVINVIASLPEQAAGEMMKGLIGGDGTSDTNAHQAARTMRLQRASRLFRLARIGRLAKLTAMKKSPLWKWLQTLRGVRIINVLVGLFFSVHLLACGWYMCASLHANPQDTWLARRYVDSLGERNLLDESDPGLQWLHAMYFILTVFTTVGFGDIAAVTPGEILYVVLTFLIGAVVHSIIIGEVISAVTRVDERGQFISEQRGLMEKFASHTELGEDCIGELQNWVTSEATKWMTQKYDKEGVRALLTGRHMYRTLEGMIPPLLFKGHFLSNRFFSALPTKRIDELPPRLPMLLALNSHRQYFLKLEQIYRCQDFSNHIFLVASGVFAYIGVPKETGGEDVNTVSAGMGRWLAAVRATVSEQTQTNTYPYQLFCRDSYFGEYGVLFNQPREATARCEARGSCIVVPKAEMERSMVDFPEFSSLWNSVAASREKMRISMRKRLTFGRSYKHLAALCIQRIWRRLHPPVLVLAKDGDDDNHQPPTTTVTPLGPPGQMFRRVSTAVLHMERVSSKDFNIPGSSATLTRSLSFAGERLVTPPTNSTDLNREDIADLMMEIKSLRMEMASLRRGRDLVPRDEPQLIGQVPLG